MSRINSTQRYIIVNPESGEHESIPGGLLTCDTKEAAQNHIKRQRHYFPGSFEGYVVARVYYEVVT